MSGILARARLMEVGGRVERGGLGCCRMGPNKRAFGGCRTGRGSGGGAGGAADEARAAEARLLVVRERREHVLYVPAVVNQKSPGLLLREAEDVHQGVQLLALRERRAGVQEDVEFGRALRLGALFPCGNHHLPAEAGRKEAAISPEPTAACPC